MNQNRDKQGVSVVLAIHVWDQACQRTVDSVLMQSPVTLELIVVGDGDPSGAGDALARLNDERVQYLPAPRAGLTRALQIGCERAIYPNIARIDRGDVMHPLRLSKQQQILETHKDVGLVSTDFALYTDRGYFLHNSCTSTHLLNAGLNAHDPADFESPVHATVMFRRDLYQRVGGYREAFYCAQDVDLWLRMTEHVQINHIAESLTAGEFSASGISGQWAVEQRQFLEYALSARAARAQLESEQDVLGAAQELSESLRMTQMKPISNSDQSRRDAAAQYFMARSLMWRYPREARRLFAESLAHRPWPFKALAGFVLSLFIWRRKGPDPIDFSNDVVSQVFADDHAMTNR